MLGLIQSPPDNRDWNYAALKAGAELPTRKVHPETPLRDQGPHGTCVGFGSANMKDVQEMSDTLVQNSPLYIYRRAKLIDGLPAGTEGTTLKAALTVLKDEGVCSEAEYPYRLVDSAVQPPAAAKAAVGKIQGYARCYTVEDIKQAIFNDGPVLIGMAVTQKFRDLGVGIHHITTLFGGPVLGGHCMTITGYDDLRMSGGKKGFFRVKNSWADWGENGYIWMAYDCVTERADSGMGYFWEAWSTIDITTGFNGTRVDLWVGLPNAIVNGMVAPLDSPPLIVNSRTMVPLRFIAETLGLKVLWDGVERRVTLLKEAP